MYEYQAKLDRVVDGDTVYLIVDLGFHIFVRMSFRLLDIDTPEVRGEERPEGLQAKAALELMLAKGTIRIETTKPGKYGRWLATLYVKQEDGTEFNVNQALLDQGYAVPYPG